MAIRLLLIITLLVNGCVAEPSPSQSLEDKERPAAGWENQRPMGASCIKCTVSSIQYKV